MAIKAYLLIEAEVGKTKRVVEAIRKLEGVVSVDVVTGPYDALAVIQGETPDDVRELIVAKMARVAGISRIVSCLAVELS